MQQAGRTLMLSDLAREFQWVQMLGWSEDELESVPVHEEATAGDEMLNLSNFGGTALGVSANAVPHEHAVWPPSVVVPKSVLCPPKASGPDGSDASASVRPNVYRTVSV